MPDFQPAGYCPHCDYRMDVGRCPECGTEVTEATLQKRPGMRRHRRIRRIVALLLALGTAVGLSRYLYRTWPSWVPSAVLLRFQGDANHPVSHELARRFMAGQLSPAQGRRMCDNAFHALKLHVPERWPANAELDLGSSYDLQLPSELTTSYWMHLEEVFQIDEVTKHTSDWSDQAFTIRWSVALPKLLPGRHPCQLTRTILLYNQRDRTTPVHTWVTRNEFVLNVVEEPYTAFLNFSDNAELSAAMRNALSRATVKKEPDNSLPWCAKIAWTQQPPPFVAHVWIRPTGSEEFRGTGACAGFAGCATVLKLWPLEDSVANVDVRLDCRPPADEKFARWALTSQCTEFFGGVVEVSNIPVQDEE